MYLAQKHSLTACLVIAALLLAPFIGGAQSDPLLQDAKAARTLALSTRVNGKVGGSFDFRVIGTDRSYNYKLRATWLTPEVIRATVRLLQLNQRLSDDQAKALVAEAEAVGGTVVLVEIDPREGSGVIPNDWTAFLQAQGKTQDRAVKGTNTPKRREIRALAGAASRDYAWDMFWVTFPLRASDGSSLFGSGDREAELLVQIYGKAGTLRWPIPESIRRRMAEQ